MNYEKKYKEAQKWIESIYSELSHEQQMEAEAFFPELRELEDERVRKEILSLVQYTKGRRIGYEPRIHQDKMIAWLEKQEGCEYIKKDWLEHIKQSWYKEGFIDGKYSGGTSKEWTINDAAIFKEIIDFLENGTAKLQHDLTKYANWLKIQFTPIEKQGRQFAVDKLKPKFHEGEWITNGDYTWKIVEVKPLDYILQSQDGNIVDDTIFHVNEQFHSFTIEDAKDGDVLATPNYVYIFNSIDKETETVSFYCLMKKSDEYFSFGDYRIHDEILNSTPATKEQRDVLFQKMKEAGYEWDAEKKELKKISQRMVSAEAKEALYDKPAWSEEDEVRFESCIKVLQTSDGYDTINTKWFKSLKDRVRPKQEWSEEDETKMRAALAFIKSEFPKKGNEEIMEDTIEWLKSLRPQQKHEWSEEDEKNLRRAIRTTKVVYPEAADWLKSIGNRITWKPSKGQLECLGYAIDKAEKDYSPLANNRVYLTLKSLKEQLKKLIE